MSEESKETTQISSDLIKGNSEQVSVPAMASLAKEMVNAFKPVDAQNNDPAMETKINAAGKLEVQDLGGMFFIRYGHKLNSVVNAMSQKQIRRVIINALGFQHDGYNPTPESDEGQLLWAMDLLVEARTTMFLHTLQERSSKEAELDFKKGQTLEDDIIKMEEQRIKETKTKGDTKDGI